MQHSFAVPQSWLRPPDATLDPPEGGPLKAWWTGSGHILVAPRLDGREVGYMILDTGTSAQSTCFLDSLCHAAQLCLRSPTFSVSRSAAVAECVQHCSSSSVKVSCLQVRQSTGHPSYAAGASGFVIEKATADALEMAAFGSFHASGMIGHMQIRLRRCASIQLGPLTVENPLFMEMQLGGLVTGGPGDVVGIVG